MKQKPLLLAKYSSILILAVTALTLVIAITAFSPSPVHAQNNSNSQANANANTDSDDGNLVPCGNNADDPCTVTDFFNIWIRVTNFGIGMAGIICMVVIIYSGYAMVFAAGNTEGVASAKKRITNAMIGLLFVVSAFVLVNFFSLRDPRFRNPIDILAHPLEYITSTSQ